MSDAAFGSRTVTDLVTVLDPDLYPNGLEQGYKTDATIDLKVAEGHLNGPLETWAAPLGVAVSVPEGWVGLIIPRSSSARAGILMSPVAIDPGFEGEIHAFITNTHARQYDRGDSVVGLLLLQSLSPGARPRKQTERGTAANASSGGVPAEIHAAEASRRLLSPRRAHPRYKLP